MKKFISIMLAALMLASAASVAVSAEIVFFDDFEEGQAEMDFDFWFDIGKFVVEESYKGENTVLSGYSDAKFALTRYTDNNGIFDPSVRGTFNELTAWVDVNIMEETDDDYIGAGLWVIDTREYELGYVTRRTEYKVMYFGKYNEESAIARLAGDDPQPDDNYPYIDPYHIYGTLNLPDVGTETEDKNGETVFVPGFNMDSEPVKLGLRYGRGNVTAYVNGKIIGTYNYETIGVNATPIILENQNAYTEFDNFTVGTYDENVKKRTRTASFTPAEADVSVSNGVDVNTVKHTEDETVTVTAPAAAEAGKSFDKWTMKIGGREVADVEAAKLLHGIEIGDLSSAELTFTMPNENVELVATYKEAAPHAVKVNEGTASAAEAVVGTTVTVTANAAPEGKIFDKWEVVAGGVALENANAASTTFVMVDADVELTATYKEGTAETHKITVTGGSANVAEAVAGTTVTVTVNEGSELEKWEVVKGGVTLADATAASTTFVMGDEDVEIKAVVKGGDVLMGDADGNGKVNAKDIIAVMRSMLGNTPENFNEKAADMDANGKINAKDIIAIMRKMLEK